MSSTTSVLYRAYNKLSGRAYLTTGAAREVFETQLEALLPPGSPVVEDYSYGRYGLVRAWQKAPSAEFLLYTRSANGAIEEVFQIKDEKGLRQRLRQLHETTKHLRKD